MCTRRRRVAAAGQAAEVRDDEHLGADVRQLDGVPAVAVQRHRGALEEGRGLRPDGEVAAGHPDVGGVQGEVLAGKLVQNIVFCIS